MKAGNSKARTYDPALSAVFMKTNERFGGLSNMAPGFPVTINGHSIRTSEALYQACRFPHLPNIQEIILAERSPMTAKMRGKPFRGDTRPDWNEVRVNVMRWCLRVKLAQNFSSFGDLLQSTGKMPIVEKKIKKTDFWGAKVTDEGTLVGQNVLGRLLMELREQLATCTESQLLRVQPLEIPRFCLLGEPIQMVEAKTKSLRRPSCAEQEPFEFYRFG